MSCAIAGTSPSEFHFTSFSQESVMVGTVRDGASDLIVLIARRQNSLTSHFNARRRDALFRLRYRIFAEMKNTCREDSVSVTLGNPSDEMIKITDAAGCDDRHAYGIRHGARQIDVKTIFGAVAIHAGE